MDESDLSHSLAILGDVLIHHIMLSTRAKANSAYLGFSKFSWFPCEFGLFLLFLMFEFLLEIETILKLYLVVKYLLLLL